jgi:hypothetical protein
MPEFAYTQILVATARSDETRAPGLPQEIAESGFVYDPPRELLAKTDEELGSMLRPVLMVAVQRCGGGARAGGSGGPE